MVTKFTVKSDDYLIYTPSQWQVSKLTDAEMVGFDKF